MTRDPLLPLMIRAGAAPFEVSAALMFATMRWSAALAAGSLAFAVVPARILAGPVAIGGMRTTQGHATTTGDPTPADLTSGNEGTTPMSKRDELIEKHADDLRTKCDHDPGMDLLRKVTIGCGPSIYNRDSSTISASSRDELETVRKNFLIGKLGLADDESLMGGIQSVITTYGRENRSKYRAVVYYLLVKHFGKETAYP